MKTVIWTACAVASGLVGAAAAQEALSADRPGFATGPGTVARGVLQVEAGFERASGGAVSAPLGLLRYGIGPDTEVRASWSGLSFGDGETDGLGGGVEVKHTLGAGERGSTGLLASLAIPAGGGSVDPSLGFLWTSSAGGLGLFGTATVGAPHIGGERRLTASNAIGASVSVTGAIGLYAEHFVSVTEGAGDEVQYLDGGITYLVSPNMQLDLNAGVGVGGAAAGDFVGGGIAYRF